MLIPAKQKYRKLHKGRVSYSLKSGGKLSFGDIGLKSLDAGRIQSKQIESARKAAVRAMKRQGKFFIRIFPSIPVSKKPAEVRMGGGKGNPEFFVFRVSPGRVLFEISGVSLEVGRKAFELVARKLPIRTKIVQSYE